ncbi:hypothetical protein SBOR_3017 [Sclerotinia borealis F-4128]|uniref:Uncharacterized protein n=1 Tax=Sclerotinia borealis (strain F-4128) TaxID=1432307 RepID=W9CQ14_SCLBF|nr:hypothetical protein SBOR_3017 [Sclerotinia borealis F-4128]
MSDRTSLSDRSQEKDKTSFSPPITLQVAYTNPADEAHVCQFERRFQYEDATAPFHNTFTYTIRATSASQAGSTEDSPAAVYLRKKRAEASSIIERAKRRARRGIKMPKKTTLGDMILATRTYIKKQNKAKFEMEKYRRRLEQTKIEKAKIEKIEAEEDETEEEDLDPDQIECDDELWSQMVTIYKILTPGPSPKKRRFDGQKTRSACDNHSTTHTLLVKDGNRLSITKCTRADP